MECLDEWFDDKEGGVVEAGLDAGAVSGFCWV